MAVGEKFHWSSVAGCQIFLDGGINGKGEGVETMGNLTIRPPPELWLTRKGEGVIARVEFVVLNFFRWRDLNMCIG